VILEDFLEGLPGKPSFQIRRYEDVNPVSGAQKVRILSIPNDAMRILHARIVKFLRRLPVDHSISTGARPKWSPRRNTSIHSGHRYLYATDISRAYESVDGQRLAGVLCAFAESLLGNEQSVFQFLKTYCLGPSSGLAVGAPASPDLFNVYSAVLIDQPLIKYCRENRLTVTRYLDDVTVSADHPIGKRKRKAIRLIIQRAGFSINHWKSSVLDLRRGTTMVTGVGLNRDGRLFVPRHFLRKIKGILLLAKDDPLEFEKKASGVMSVFFATRKPRESYNRTERRIFDLWSEFRLRLAQEKSRGRR